jgi:hypothetical protein
MAKGYGTPSLYGAGYVQYDFTTCLPAPQSCWGPLGRSEQAVFRGPDFGWISVLAILHRPQHPEQTQTWPNGPTYSIVHEEPAFAETRPICFGLWCAKWRFDQFSFKLQIEAIEQYVPQNRTIWLLLTVIKKVVWQLCLVSNRWLVAEICPFQLLRFGVCWVIQKLSLLLVYIL